MVMDRGRRMVRKNFRETEPESEVCAGRVVAACEPAAKLDVPAGAGVVDEKTT
jgi:hypothetical protein